MPVITTNVGGNTEIIKDGEDGLLVGYNDKEAIKQAILRLYKDRELAITMGVKGMKTAKGFSTERMLGDLIKLFKK